MSSKPEVFLGFTLTPYQEGDNWRVRMTPDPMNLLESRDSILHSSPDKALDEARLFVRSTRR
jgi:hypothetical protein